MWDEITYRFLNVNGCTIDVSDCDMGPYGFMHYNDVIISAIASQITSPTSLAFVRGIHRWPMASQHKGQVTRNMFPFDDVIMGWRNDWVQVIWTNHRQCAVLYRYVYIENKSLCLSCKIDGTWCSANGCNLRNTMWTNVSISAFRFPWMIDQLLSAL